jgi:hypothetical protein
MNIIYVWTTIFFCIGYLIVTDNSVNLLFIFFGKFIRLQYEKIKWIILYSPDNPWVKWMIHRKYLKLVKELEKDLKK